MISLATIVERTIEPLVFVDFNGDERDPAWQAVCSDMDDTSYWQGVWHHADTFLAWGDVEGDDSAWQEACRQAEEAAMAEGQQHRADVHHD